jgi:hypothetical protein
MITEQARSDVYINGQQAGQELEKLATRAEKLKKEMVEMRKANDKAGFDKKQKELRNVNKEMKDLQKQAFDVNKVLKNMKSTSLNELYKAQRQLNREMRKLPQNSKEFKQMEKDSQKLSNQINKVKMNMKGTNSAIAASGKLWSNLKSMLPIAGLASIVGLLGRFGKGLLVLKREMDGDAKRAAIVFGDQLGYVQAQADKLAQKMGLTNKQFIAVAASTADLLVPLHFTRDQAAKMSVELQGLVGALDEWTGGQVGATEISQILTKAMLGENEQLKQLGIAIKMDSEEYRTLVKQKMEANKLTKEQAQAMATLELIQMKSIDAQRAYNTEGNRLLRFQKEASRQWRHLRENIVSRFDIPTAKLMEEEANKANLLTAQLMNTNIEEGKRKDIFDQIKKIYPDILKGIDQENIDTGKLVKNLAEYNVEMAKKIALSQLEEEEQKKLMGQAGKYNKVIMDQTDAISFYNEYQSKMQQQLSSIGKEMPDEMITSFTKIRAAIEDTFENDLDMSKIQTAQKELYDQTADLGDFMTHQYAIKIRQFDEDVLFALQKSSQKYRGFVEKNKDALQGLADAQKLIMESLKVKPNKIIDGDPDDEKKIKDRAAYDAHLYQQMIKKEIFKRKKTEGHPIDWIFNEEEAVPDDMPWLSDWASDFWQQFDETYEGQKMKLEAMREANLITVREYNQKLTDIEENQREESFRIAQRKLQDQYNLYTSMAVDLTNAMIHSWDDRKRAESDYNEAVAELRGEYKEGRMSVEQYEEQLAELNRERKKEEIELEKKRGKEALIVLLDYLQKYLVAKIAQMTIGSLASPESIATAGIAGVAKAAVLTALAQAAFGIVKTKLSQNFEGRYPVVGAQDNRTYYATDSGMATTGIYRTPTLVAERGTEMIVDNPTLRNISINRPDILRDIQSLRVPQYASGRFPGDSASAASSSSTGETESVQWLKTIASQTSELLKALKAGNIQAVVSDYQVREIRNRTNVINDIEKRITK